MLIFYSSFDDISEREISHQINLFLSVFANKQYDSMEIAISTLNNKQIAKDQTSKWTSEKTGAPILNLWKN